jgi:hypothetical protein
MNKRDRLDRHKKSWADTPPCLKRLSRVIRKLHQIESREHRAICEGYHINRPRIGDVLLHIRSGLDAPRKTIRFTPFGMRWEPTPDDITARFEFMEAAE